MIYALSPACSEPKMIYALSPACRLVPKALVKLSLRSETSASGRPTSRILATRNINVTAAVLAMAVLEVRISQERSVMRSICTCNKLWPVLATGTQGLLRLGTGTAGRLVTSGRSRAGAHSRR